MNPSTNLSIFIDMVSFHSHRIPDPIIRNIAAKFSLDCFEEYSKIINNNFIPKHNGEPVPQNEIDPNWTVLSDNDLQSEREEISNTPEHSSSVSIEEKKDEECTRLINPSLEFISAETIDEEIYNCIDLDKIPRVTFSVKITDENSITKYFNTYFPDTEYDCSFLKDANEESQTIIKIYYRGLKPVDELEQKIRTKLDFERYVDILTTFSFEEFEKHVSSFCSTDDIIFTRKVINDRIVSYRFRKSSTAKFLMPSKALLESKFIEYKGDKTPTVYIQNVPNDIIFVLRGKIHGFSFIRTKKQPLENGVGNILIFSKS